MIALIVANVLWQLHKSRGSYDPKFVIDECAENYNGVTLRGLLGEYGVNLLFQPPSPHLNTCELCFHQIKAFLNSNQMLAENETEIAILEACSCNSTQNSMAYYRHCGYVIWGHKSHQLPKKLSLLALKYQFFEIYKYSVIDVSETMLFLAACHNVIIPLFVENKHFEK